MSAPRLIPRNPAAACADGPSALVKSMMKVLALLAVGIFGSLHVFAQEVAYSLDFTTQPPGSALPWLKRNGFEFKLDFERLDPRFEDGALRFSTAKPQTGICELTFPKDKLVARVQRLRLTWGVTKSPQGIDWDRGMNRTPLAAMVCFGQEKLSSGLPFGRYAQPYFLSPFFGAKEKEGTVYTGKLYKAGGRYIAAKTGKPGETVVSEFDVDALFKTVFSKSQTPAISALGFQMNTKDLTGPAAAFIKKLELIR